MGHHPTFFLQELKNLQARDFTTMGIALKKAIEHIKIYRVQVNLDNYGQVSTLQDSSSSYTQFSLFQGKNSLVL
jgi:hypothetical protein